MNENFAGIRKTIDHCVACTACMAACPVMRALQDYRGPKLIAPAHGRLHFSQDDFDRSLEFCSNCKSCDRACPNGVSVSNLNMQQRGKFFESHKHSQRDKILAHIESAGKKIRTIPFGHHAANWGSSVGKILGISEKIGITAKRPLPIYARKNFKTLFKSIHQQKSDRKIVFYPGCYINENDPDVGVALIRVMNANGIEVLLDENFRCCGSPLISTGFMNESRLLAENNSARIQDWKSKNIPVVAACTTCSLVLKSELAEIFGDDRFANDNVFDAFEFLETIDLNLNLASIPKRILYHVPCHLKSQGIGLPAREILSEIPDLKIELADAGCCGLSGNFGYKKELYDVSMKIGRELFDRILSSDADEVMSECGPCRMQIQHGTNREPMHPLEILAGAYLPN